MEVCMAIYNYVGKASLYYVCVKHTECTTSNLVWVITGTGLKNTWILSKL